MSQTRPQRATRAPRSTAAPAAPANDRPARTTKDERKPATKIVLQFTPKPHPPLNITSWPPTKEQRATCIAHNEALLKNCKPEQRDDAARYKQNIADLRRAG